MSQSINLRFDGGSVGQEQQRTTPHTIRNLTVRNMIITESGVAYSKKVLCDLDTPIAAEPGFSPVSPEQLAQYVNAGDYIQLDLKAVMDSPESSVYRAFFNAVAFVNSSAGETTSEFNAYVLETDSKNFLNPIEVVFTVASDQLTSIQYLVVYDTKTLENTMVHDLILQDSVIVVDDTPATKHILCDKQHKTGNLYTPVSPERLATWVKRGDYIALGTEASNDNSTSSPLPMTNAVMTNDKCTSITFGGLSDGNTTKFGTGATITDEATGIEYIHIAAINVNSAVHDVQYIDIESIDNPPSGLYLNIQTAITAGKVPVIRYDGALYYFDKEYISNDSPAYSFAGRLDSDEWKTAIRVTSEGVTLGNVLGVNGTVANGVHNSFPLGGGKCGAESGDPDYPYLEFDRNVYASYGTFNGNGGFGYVSNGSADPVSITINGVTTTVNPLHKALVMAVARPVVKPSNLPKGYILIEKNGLTVAAGSAVFYYGQDTPGVVEADGYTVLIFELTMKRTDDLSGLLGIEYTIHGGFWVKTDHTSAINGLANGPASLATGNPTSTALNNGKAAGPLSLANGKDALAAGPYSVVLQEDGIAEQNAMSGGNGALALHMGSKVLAAGGVSGRQFQTVLGRDNELDPESVVVVGWVNKNISKMDTDGDIFTGKRLDLANNVMPLFKLPDSDPDSPGTEPVTGYWICDSKKQLVTAEEIVALHAMGMKFVLCESTDPASNSRMYVEQKSIITDSNIDIEFVSADDATIRKVVVQKETTSDVTDASLFITSSTVTYVANIGQVKDTEEMLLANLPCNANTLRFKFSKMDYDPTVAGVGSIGTWKKLSAKFNNVWEWTKSGAEFTSVFSGAFDDIGNLVSVIASGDMSSVTDMTAMFANCTSLTSVPLFDTSAVTNMSAMFINCTKVEGGALALYQQASAQTTPPSSHTGTFTNCGSDTVTGAAELAQIPASWGGTAP